jgi:hypothetical protein
MTEHWDPYSKEKSTVPDGIWVSGISGKTKAIPDVPVEPVVERKPIINSLAQRPTWIARERAGAERCILYLTTWILAVTFVAVGAGIGMVIARFYEIANIILVDGLGW